MTGLVGLSDVDAEDTLTAPTISLPFTSDSSDAHGVIAVVLALATRLPAPVEGFFHRERIRALPKSRAARWTKAESALATRGGVSSPSLDIPARRSARVSSEAPDVRNARACGTRMARARAGGASSGETRLKKAGTPAGSRDAFPAAVDTAWRFIHRTEPLVGGSEIQPWEPYSSSQILRAQKRCNPSISPDWDSRDRFAGRNGAGRTV